VAAVDDASSASELRGEVLGDATRALASLGEVNEVGAQLVVSCRNLVRVDFSAAGGILNWVALRQAEGGQVQFTDVHRLVAAFFIVIGINEHGRVIPRLI
jgi:anti-anti-sigma regulatory factor